VITLTENTINPYRHWVWRAGPEFSHVADRAIELVHGLLAGLLPTLAFILVVTAF
jgi:hypothetical protein